MKDTIIRNEKLTVYINAFGAELKGVEMNGIEYLWQGGIDTYPRTSPTLFPVMGRFLSDTYYVGDKDYQMQLNGFALDSNFEITRLKGDSVTFTLLPNERTRKSYPFEFALHVTYTVKDNALIVHHKVENKGDAPLPFCIGSHTAYKWPLMPEDQPEDYFLRFEKEETLDSFNPFGWTQRFVEGKIRPLSHDLFANYTRSLKDIQSEWIELACHKHDHAVRIHRSQYPFLAIWTMPTPNAALICLEPSTSVHPGNHPSLHLEDRDGALVLAPGETFDNEFMVEFR